MRRQSRPCGATWQDGLHSVHEVAALLAVSRSKVYGLMREGRLSYVKLGRARRIPARAVAKLIDDHLITEATRPASREVAALAAASPRTTLPAT